MRNLILVLSIIISSLLAFTYVQAKQSDLYYDYDKRITVEKEAMVNWIISKYPKIVKEAQAIDIVESVYANSVLNNLNPLLVFSIIDRESTFKRFAKSNYGAIGYMQIVPRYHRNKLNKRNPVLTDVNIEVGSEILRDCLISKKGNVNKALGCYSGGARYNDKIKKSHEEMRQHVIAYQFSNEHPVHTEYRFSQPFVYWPAAYKQTQIALSSF
jgi:soluble lytic murein transglycosylase-like protein